MRILIIAWFMILTVSVSAQESTSEPESERIVKQSIQGSEFQQIQRREFQDFETRINLRFETIETRLDKMRDTISETANSVAGFEGMLKGLLQGKNLNLSNENTDISNRTSWIGIITAIAVLITLIITVWPKASKTLNQLFNRKS